MHRASDDGGRSTLHSFSAPDDLVAWHVEPLDRLLKRTKARLKDASTGPSVSYTANLGLFPSLQISCTTVVGMIFFKLVACERAITVPNELDKGCCICS